MAKKRKRLKPAEKRQIIEEAGNKCANPGCTNWRVHIHHIQHWAVYESNNSAILIAVCPSCHDAIHHGVLEISDDVLYQWKGIERDAKPSTTHVYVEPSDEIMLLTGTMAISTTLNAITVFELSETNKLSFKVLDGDIALINLRVSDLRGTEVLKVSDNYVRVQDPEALVFEQVPGHVKVSSKDIENFITPNFLTKMRVQEPNYPEDDELVLLELEVLKPGLVKVKGCWANKNQAVIITDRALSFVKNDLREPISLIGAGEASVLKYVGPIDCALFGFRSENTGALRI